MELIEWNLEYSVGVSEIDEQHKDLMSIINGAIYYSSSNNKEERIYLDRTIISTIKFIENHFKTEELYLSKTNYEEYNKHKLEHKKILENIQTTKYEIQNNNIEINLFNIATCLKGLFLDHIKLFDKKAEGYFLEGKNKQ